MCLVLYGGGIKLKQERFCCPNCFENKHIKNYIEENHEYIGNCSYCESASVSLISIEKLGIHMRDCIAKAYDGYDNGTGAMYDSEDRVYIGPTGDPATMYSIREIMTEEEEVFSDEVLDTTLVDDLFENLYTPRQIQKGDYDPFEDIDSQEWVIKDDLYGSEQTRAFHAWESFKHIVKHYNRFFDSDRFSVREKYLEQIAPYFDAFTEILSKGTKFYRARKVDTNLLNLDRIEPYKQMGPPPAVLAKTNRMSPAGMPYLYLASDGTTALKECRISSDDEAIIAEFVLIDEVRILDLSKGKRFGPASIFDPKYDHDDRWMTEFWSSFIKEVSEPISEEKTDHSYEYVATQLIAEYIKNKGYDGICFRSSVGSGDNYVFFVGPDPQCNPKAYPYPFDYGYPFNHMPILRVFTEIFKISKISKVDVYPHVIEEAYES